MDSYKQDFEKAIERLQAEYSKLRTNRANPSILDAVKVDYYGQQMQIQGLASVSVPEPMQLLIQPWDKNSLQPIEEAIRKSELGLNPTNEGDKLRISLPELTKERREELVKMASRMAEEARVSIRNNREAAWKEAQKQEDAGEITEDDKFAKKEELQELVDEYNEQIKKMLEKKEEEIRTI